MLHDAFQKFKSNLELNETFEDTIQRRHNAVRSVIENNGHNIETKLIGSLQRQTRIQPKEGDAFDIDVLVVLGSFYNWLPAGSPGGVTPQAAMETLHEVVSESERYDSMNPQQDQPTVSLEYQDNTKVELVPAYLDMIGTSSNGISHSPTGRAYWIPKDNQWILADYDHDASHITRHNQLTGGWLIPTIKMLKSAKREYFPALDSFHLEIIATNIIPAIVVWQKQNGVPTSYSALVTDFFNYAGSYLDNPIKIPGSHSPHCSLEITTKATVSKIIEQIKTHCNSIEKLGSDTAKLKAWRTLFGDAFPLQI